MSAKLYRRGDAWIVQALACHCFPSAKAARDWARRNNLKLTRSNKADR